MQFTLSSKDNEVLVFPLYTSCFLSLLEIEGGRNTQLLYLFQICLVTDLVGELILFSVYLEYGLSAVPYVSNYKRSERADGG